MSILDKKFQFRDVRKLLGHFIKKKYTLGLTNYVLLFSKFQGYVIEQISCMFIVY